MTERPAPPAAHEKGVVHRDLKPENLFVEQIAFLGPDEKGTNGVFVQDFAPGKDTRSSRRKRAGFDPELQAETFGVSPDGSRVAIAGREIVSSLVLLEGVTGLGPSK